MMDLFGNIPNLQRELQRNNQLLTDLSQMIKTLTDEVKLLHTELKKSNESK